MTNFTCLVGIPLSDMSEEGSGNVGLMRGSHHDMQAFLNRQVRERVAPATLILSAPAPPFVSLVMVYCLTHVWRATQHELGGPMGAVIPTSLSRALACSHTLWLVEQARVVLNGLESIQMPETSMACAIIHPQCGQPVRTEHCK